MTAIEKDILEKEELLAKIPEILPILPVKDTVVFPTTISPILVAKERSLKLVNDALVGDRLIGLVALKNTSEENSGPENNYSVGTVGRIQQFLKTPDGTIQLLIAGIERIRIVEYTQTEPYFKGRIEIFPDEDTEKSIELEALIRNLQGLFQKFVSLSPHLPEDTVIVAINIEDSRQLLYFIASFIKTDLVQKQEFLELKRIREKIERLTSLLTREIEVLELGKKIQTEAQEEMKKSEKEYILRQQLRAIQKELGEEDKELSDIKNLHEKVIEAKMSQEAEKEAFKELGRLEKMSPASAEYSVIKTYLDWLIYLPWAKTTAGKIDIGHTKKVLDEDHYDLEKVKERILEYLAVRKLGEERRKPEETSFQKEPILCFIGPPGVGKTSLAQSIAKALGRKMVRISLGGLSDEAEIRGHRRTYIGALPGRIIQMIRRVESRDPVFVFDEIDKLRSDWRGDPASALLEVLDPEQNRDFRDNYLDVAFDLSSVMFITTANQLDPIPPALRDRLEVLFLPGYTEDEKVMIAKRYLISKQTKANSLTEEEILFDDDALKTMISDYTREAGVRNLEREIANVCRKIAKEVAEKKKKTFRIKKKDIHEYLGKPRFFSEVAERTGKTGIATGLAWTPAGGDILFVEATKMPGKKSLILTGQLGDVMQESAKAALSYIRSKAEELGIDKDFFEQSDIHIHVPAGAISKDGPSAGITIAVAIASLFTGRPVRPDVAMTGEITLRGKVLPIGGVKEKVLAALRAGIHTVILPERNRMDIDEISKEQKKKIKFIFIENIDQGIKAAFLPVKKPLRK